MKRKTQTNEASSSWQAYEQACVVEHQRLFPGWTVWPQNKVPESEWYDAGVIHDFAKTRHDRLRARAESSKAVYQLPDYGVDFLARHDTLLLFHFGQAKQWQHTVRAADLGTFLVKLMAAQHTRPGLVQGHLYLTSQLEQTLCEHLLASQVQIHHFEPRPWRAWQPKQDEPSQSQVLTLRPYQRAAVEATLACTTWAIVQMPCGTGKTAVAGEVLQHMRDRYVVVMAPMRLSVDQLVERIAPSCDRHLLVDTDGTTDESIVGAFLDDGPGVLFATYDSALDVVLPVLAERGIQAYIVVDEAHNVTSRYDKMIAEHTGLLLSATVPESLYDLGESVYKYSYEEALRDGIVCDYRMYLPLRQDDTPELEQQVHFLWTGLLQHGHRRGISYHATVAEAQAFADIFARVGLAFHGLSAFVRVLTHETKDRRDLLATFGTRPEPVTLLCSVRCLDEAIDLVSCDFEFLSKVDGACRTVQRCMRGCRVDPSNPAKINGIFAWADDTEIDMLTLMKNADLSFTSKISRTAIDYDSQRSVAIQSQVASETLALQEHVRVKCLTVAQLQEWKAAQLLAYVDLHGKAPLKSYVDGFRMGQWWNNLMHGCQSKHIYESLLQSNAILKSEHDRLQALKAVKVSQTQLTPEYKAQALLAYVETYGKVPSAVYIQDFPMGVWWQNIKQGKSKNIYETLSNPTPF